MMTLDAPQSPILLFLDWDSTLTTTSTLPLIASIATYPTQNPKLAGLSKAYSDDLRTYDVSYHPKEEDRRSLDQELAYLNGLEHVERASIHRIEEVGLFKDISDDHVRRVAAKAVENGEIQLRKGWKTCLQLIQRQEDYGIRGNVSIISVAWSALFIGACLKAAQKGSSDIIMSKGPQVTISSNLSRFGVEDVNIHIYANDFNSFGSRKLLGTYCSTSLILTAGDKLKIFKTILTDSMAGDADTKPMTVYMGDSPTDLACLVNADIGICIRDEEMSEEQKDLGKTLERLGIEVRRIRHYPRDTSSNFNCIHNREPGNKTLWWARDFLEVVEARILS